MVSVVDKLCHSLDSLELIFWNDKDYINGDFGNEMNNLLLYDNQEYQEFDEMPPEFRPDERNAFSYKLDCTCN